MSNRNPAHRDSALLLGALAITVVRLLVSSLPYVRSTVLSWFVRLHVIAQPFLLLRLVRRFHGLSNRTWAASRVGMSTSWLLAPVSGSQTPLLITIASVPYVIRTHAYALAGFRRGAASTSSAIRTACGLRLARED